MARDRGQGKEITEHPSERDAYRQAACAFQERQARLRKERDDAHADAQGEADIADAADTLAAAELAEDALYARMRAEKFTERMKEDHEWQKEHWDLGYDQFDEYRQIYTERRSKQFAEDEVLPPFPLPKTPPRAREQWMAWRAGKYDNDLMQLQWRATSASTR